MRQAVNGWLVVSVILVVLGIAAVVSTRVIPGTTLPDSMIADWRQYATEVEHHKRTPSPITTRMLTETAISQHEYARAAEPWHATLHAGLTLAFAAWAQRLGRSSAQPAQAAPANRLEDLEAELDQLRGELAEAQERLDFTERVLARESAVRRPDADPPR